MRRRTATALADALAIQKGNRRRQQGARISAAYRERLERLGRERTLIYRTLVLAGLRKGELASITVGQVDLTGPVPYLILHARDEKARRGAEIPLRKDLAAELRAWMEETLVLTQAEAREHDEPAPARLPPTAKLLDVAGAVERLAGRGRGRPARMHHTVQPPCADRRHCHLAPFTGCGSWRSEDLSWQPGPCSITGWP